MHCKQIMPHTCSPPRSAVPPGAQNKSVVHRIASHHVTSHRFTAHSIIPPIAQMPHQQDRSVSLSVAPFTAHSYTLTAQTLHFPQSPFTITLISTLMPLRTQSTPLAQPCSRLFHLVVALSAQSRSRRCLRSTCRARALQSLVARSIMRLTSSSTILSYSSALVPSSIILFGVRPRSPGPWPVLPCGRSEV